MKKFVIDSAVCLMFVIFEVFATLKLLDLIDWSWWLVTLPLWGLVAALLLAIVVGTVILSVKDGDYNRRS